MSNHEELKAHIDHVKRVLRFYTLYGDEVVSQGMSKRELEKLIDIQLDKLAKLLQQLKD